MRRFNVFHNPSAITTQDLCVEALEIMLKQFYNTGSRCRALNCFSDHRFTCSTVAEENNRIPCDLWKNIPEDGRLKGATRRKYIKRGEHEKCY